MKLVRCYMCKASGHLASDCDKDPNIRTTFDVEEENTRVGKALVNKKVRMSDGSAVTNNLLEQMAILSNERITCQMMQ